MCIILWSRRQFREVNRSRVLIISLLTCVKWALGTLRTRVWKGSRGLTAMYRDTVVVHGNNQLPHVIQMIQKKITCKRKVSFSIKDLINLECIEHCCTTSTKKRAQNRPLAAMAQYGTTHQNDWSNKNKFQL